MDIVTIKPRLKLIDYLEKKLRSGSITFTKSDAIGFLGSSELAFLRSAQRLQKKGILLKPVNGFYVIIEVEYRSAGGPQPIYFLAKMMKYLKLPYYVGLLSAAKYHGATHQSVFETQVCTTKPLLPIKYGKHRIQFITNKFTERIPKQLLTTPHGDIQISSSEATLVDMIRYNKKSVGLSHVATVILEMRQKINEKKIKLLTNIYHDVPLMQRVGYLLEVVSGKPANFLQQWLRSQEVHVIKLEPRLKKSRNKNSRWSVDVNTIVKADSI